ncbi:MAG: hypothetical protein R3C14_28810 [Caldilineaceae bacterium]
MSNNETQFVRRKVAADLIEATPGMGGLGHWLLASPTLIFILWLWVDIFQYWSPLSLRWLNLLISVPLFVLVIVLPLGYLAHRLVLSLPRLLQHAGWDIQPLETVRPEEMYTVRYLYQQRHWAPHTWPRLWLRVAQGWVYLEILAIFAGAILMPIIFFSAVDFGFGQ